MAPTSLLRYVFRHVPHGRSHDAALTPNPAHTTSPAPSKEQETRPSSPTESNISEEPESPLARKTRPESRASTVLEDVTEESVSDDSASLAESFAALGLEADTFTTCDLLTATLKGAKTSLHEHLDTLNTTLEILSALDGFSATITAVKEEMEVTKELCEEKLKAMRYIERAVESMQFLEQ